MHSLTTRFQGTRRHQTRRLAQLPDMEHGFCRAGQAPPQESPGRGRGGVLFKEYLFLGFGRLGLCFGRLLSRRARRFPWPRGAALRRGIGWLGARIPARGARSRSGSRRCGRSLGNAWRRSRWRTAVPQSFGFCAVGLARTATTAFLGRSRGLAIRRRTLVRGGHRRIRLRSLLRGCCRDGRCLRSGLGLPGSLFGLRSAPFFFRR